MLVQSNTRSIPKPKPKHELTKVLLSVVAVDCRGFCQLCNAEILKGSRVDIASNVSSWQASSAL